jgi:hypothetical protein
MNISEWEKNKYDKSIWINPVKIHKTAVFEQKVQKTQAFLFGQINNILFQANSMSFYFLSEQLTCYNVTIHTLIANDSYISREILQFLKCQFLQELSTPDDFLVLMLGFLLLYS